MKPCINDGKVIRSQVCPECGASCSTNHADFNLHWMINGTPGGWNETFIHPKEKRQKDD